MSYIYLIFIIISILLILIAIYKCDYEEILREMAFYFVLKAEKEFGKGTGDLKYAFVITWIHDKLPPLLKYFFTEKKLNQIIEDSVRRLKKYLENSVHKTVS